MHVELINENNKIRSLIDQTKPGVWKAVTGWQVRVGVCVGFGCVEGRCDWVAAVLLRCGRARGMCALLCLLSLIHCTKKCYPAAATPLPPLEVQPPHAQMLNYRTCKPTCLRPAGCCASRPYLCLGVWLWMQQLQGTRSGARLPRTSAIYTPCLYILNIQYYECGVCDRLPMSLWYDLPSPSMHLQRITMRAAVQ